MGGIPMGTLNRDNVKEGERPYLEMVDERLKYGEISSKDIEEMKNMIREMRKGNFFEALTNEFSGKIKEIARELISFRKDIQKRIEPEIAEMAVRDIPEASNQLEGINETLEKSTMKIMDISEEQMDIANNQLLFLKSFISGNGKGNGLHTEAEKERSLSLDDALDVIRKQADVLRNIVNLSLNMMEPLSFQDLVGQRIQKIVRLVKTMETRIQDLVISFGIKIKKYKEDPARTFDDLDREVEEYKSELKGPQGEGEGMDQTAIDELLATL